MATEKYWYPQVPIGQSVYETSSTQKAKLGTPLVLGDTIHRYAKFAGGAAVVRGHVLAAPITSTHHENMVVVAGAIGGTTITCTNGGTAVTADQFAEGTLVVNAGTGIGQVFRIKSNLVMATTNGTITITTYDALPVALDTTSRVTLRKNDYDTVELVAAAGAGIPVGVSNTTLATTQPNYFGWLQTWGEGPGLAAVAGITVNLPCQVSSTIAGTIEDFNHANTTVDGWKYKLLGWTRYTVASASVGLVDWRIRGL